MLTLPWPEAQAISATIVDDRWKLPHGVVVHLLQKYVAFCVGAADFAGVVGVVNPFLPPAQFDPLKPALAALPAPPGGTRKFAHLGELLFQRSLVPHIIEGESKSDFVLRLTEAAIAELSEVEPLDLEDDAAEHLSTALVTLKALRSVILMSYDGASVGVLGKLRAATSSKPHSIMNSIGCALDATPF